jgi:hypothetical protein
MSLRYGAIQEVLTPKCFSTAGPHSTSQGGKEVFLGSLV